MRCRWVGLASRHDHYGTKLCNPRPDSWGSSPVWWVFCWAGRRLISEDRLGWDIWDPSGHSFEISLVLYAIAAVLELGLFEYNKSSMQNGL